MCLAGCDAPPPPPPPPPRSLKHARRYIDEFMADTTIDNIIRALTPSAQKLKERSAAREYCLIP
jgi:hypothetical protein